MTFSPPSIWRCSRMLLPAGIRLDCLALVHGLVIALIVFYGAGMGRADEQGNVGTADDIPGAIDVLAGTWRADVTAGEDRVLFEMKLRAEQGKVAGQFQILEATDKGAEKDVKQLMQTTYQQGNLVFVVPVGEKTGDNDDVRFELTLRGGRLEGFAREVDPDSERIKVVFTRLAGIRPEPKTKVSGSDIRVPGPDSSTDLALSGELVKKYRGMTTAEHLFAAGIKVDALQKKLQGSDDKKRLDALAELAKAVDAASDFYLGPNATSGTAPPKPDAPRPHLSPLSLLTHLRIAHENIVQTWGNMQTQPIRFTREQAERLAALRKASDALEKAIPAAELVRAWTRHAHEAMQISLAAPNQFQPYDQGAWPLKLHQVDADGNNRKLVYVEVLKRDRKISPEAFRQQRFKQITRNRQQVKLVETAQGHADNLKGKYAFVYTYAWDDQRLRVLVHGVIYREQVYEIHCVALAEQFNRDEFDEMLASFRHAR